MKRNKLEITAKESSFLNSMTNLDQGYNLGNGERSSCDPCDGCGPASCASCDACLGYSCNICFD